ncbi:MAG: P-loop NTPase fold protein [Ignavibacteria bacterium]
MTNPKDDKLGYRPFAENLAKSLQINNIAEGIVVGIYGKWGYRQINITIIYRNLFKEDSKGR